jgi:hypothetical protein
MPTSPGPVRLVVHVEVASSMSVTRHVFAAVLGGVRPLPAPHSYGCAASATTPVRVPTSTNPPARVGVANREV